MSESDLSSSSVHTKCIALIIYLSKIMSFGNIVIPGCLHLLSNNFQWVRGDSQGYFKGSV